MPCAFRFFYTVLCFRIFHKKFLFCRKIYGIIQQEICSINIV